MPFVFTGEPFRFKVPRQTVQVGIDFEYSTLQSKVCVDNIIKGGQGAPTVHVDADGDSYLLVSIDHFNNSGVSANVNATRSPIDGYVLNPKGGCAQMWSQSGSGGVGFEYNMVLAMNEATGPKRYMYNQRLEVFTQRYSQNVVHVQNVSITAGKVMLALELPVSAQVFGFQSYPVQIRYRNTSAIPLGIRLNTVTGALTGTPESSNNESVLDLYEFNIVGRDQGQLDVAGGLVAASYKFVVFPKLTYAGDIQVLTIQQKYEGSVPTIMGGAAPIRFMIKDPATLPPGLQVDATNGKIYGSPTDVFLSTVPAVVVLKDANNAEEALRGTRFHVKMPIQLRVKNIFALRLPTGVAGRSYKMSRPMIEWRQDDSGGSMQDVLAAIASKEVRAVLASLDMAVDMADSSSSTSTKVSRSRKAASDCLQACNSTKAILEAQSLDVASVDLVVKNCRATCETSRGGLSAGTAATPAPSMPPLLEGVVGSASPCLNRNDSHSRCMSQCTAARASQTQGSLNASHCEVQCDASIQDLERHNCSLVSTSTTSTPKAAISLDGYREYSASEMLFRFIARYCDRSATCDGIVGPTGSSCCKSGLPLGLILDPATARIYGIPEQPARYNISIFAVQEGTGLEFLVNSGAFSLDILECGDAGRFDDGNGGPPTCFNGGTCKHANGTATHDRFDGVYSCVCPFKYTGDRCEITRAAAQSAGSATNNDVALAVSVSVFGFILIIICASLVLWRYKVRRHTRPCLPPVRRITHSATHHKHIL